MKSRIAIWTGLGAVVVAFWTLYTFAAIPTALVRHLAYLTCLIALAREHALSFGFVLLVNAATYALIGMVVEILRWQYQTHLLQNRSSAAWSTSFRSSMVTRFTADGDPAQRSDKERLMTTNSSPKSMPLKRSLAPYQICMKLERFIRLRCATSMKRV